MADPVRHKDFDTYLARANEARAEAESATLANVRERCLRAEAAWREMAGRVQRTETMRTAALAARAALAGSVPT
jgi:hypothetical protein